MQVYAGVGCPLISKFFDQLLAAQGQKYTAELVPVFDDASTKMVDN